MKKVINKISFISFSLILGSLFISCNSSPKTSKEPAWVHYPRSVYPEEEYLSYVGTGLDKKQAEIEALNGLSSIFEQNIESTAKATSRLTEAKKGGIVASSNEKEYDLEISKKVNVENLTGVEIKEFWFDNSEFEWNAIAVLDRKFATSLYKDMLIKNAEVISKITNGVNNDLYSLQAYCAYDFAQEIARENKKHLQRLYVIDYTMAEALKNYAIPESSFIEKKRVIANKIPMYIEIEGDDDGKVESAFLDAFKEYNFSGSEDKSSRYVIKGTVSFEKEDTRDGKTTKCNYKLQTTVLDTKTSTQLFPINVRGRQSHITYEKAKERAESDIIEKINKEFIKNFNNYLTSYTN